MNANAYFLYEYVHLMNFSYQCIAYCIYIEITDESMNIRYNYYLIFLFVFVNCLIQLTKTEWFMNQIESDTLTPFGNFGLLIC